METCKFLRHNVARTKDVFTLKGGRRSMMNHILQRWGICVAASLLVAPALLSAKNCCKSNNKKCKTFGSLVVRCALNAGCLNVTNNVTIGGNLTVSGTVTTTNGMIGDLLAFGNWINTTATVIGGATNVPFPTVVGTPDNITIDATNSIFTINLAGTYLIAYEVIGSVDADSSLTLQRTPAGGTIGAVTGGAVDFPTNGGTLEISNVVLVPSVGVGDTFNLLNGANAITPFDSVNPPANGAAITFIRIHA